MALYAGYGNAILLHGADALVVHRSQDPRVVILECGVHGKIIRTGAAYDNRFIIGCRAKADAGTFLRITVNECACRVALRQSLLTTILFVPRHSESSQITGKAV